MLSRSQRWRACVRWSLQGVALYNFSLDKLQTVIFPEEAGTVRVDLPYGGDPMSPFYYITVPNDEVAARIASRTILTKGIFEVWAESDSLDGLLAALREMVDVPGGGPVGPYRKREDGRSWRYAVESFGKKMTFDQANDFFKELDFLGIEGKVDLANASDVFTLIKAERDPDGGLPDSFPTRLYFGRQICSTDRSFLNEFALSKRKYIGPTSMDHEMAFLMCNMGKVRRGSLVMDPFVGTGSILVSAAHRGAVTLGMDIDIRVVVYGKDDGKGGRVDVFSNFDQKALPRPTLLRTDIHRHPFRPTGPILDSIVCDPPYGVRAGGRKSQRSDKYIPPEFLQDHIPSTAPYTFGECVADLLGFASRYLVLGGRLVFFIPWALEVCNDEDLEPLMKHPFMKIRHISDQLLNFKYCRRLFTMDKVAPFDEAVEQAYSAQHSLEEMTLDRSIHDYYYNLAQDGPTLDSGATVLIPSYDPNASGSAAEGQTGVNETESQEPRPKRGRVVPQSANMPKHRGKNL